MTVTPFEIWVRDFERTSGLKVPTDGVPELRAQSALTAYRQLIDHHSAEFGKLQQALRLIEHLAAAPPEAAAPKPGRHRHPLTAKQIEALSKVREWLSDRKQPYFVLKGFAGTGKTYLMQMLAEHLEVSTSIFSAPTNKATKLLRESLPRFNCRTIYSAMSLKMTQREDELVLTPSDSRFNLKGYKLIVVDESSMLSSELLNTYIARVARQFGIKFLFVGDRAQLPPIGEEVSPVFELDCPTIELDEVVRHQNQILMLATHVRKAIVEQKRLKPINLRDFDGKRCVWHVSRPMFEEKLRKLARKGFEDVRAIAWRNRTVDSLNSIVREELHGLDAPTWVIGDHIVITEAVQEKDRILATVDDEGIVAKCDVGADPETGLKCYFVHVKMETGITLRLRVIHEDGEHELSSTLSDIASAARQPGQGKKWREFWWLKNRFNGIRHSYAITSHRSQGSTVKVALVDAGDILANPARWESYRSLYVSLSRPSDKLYVTGLPT